MKRALLCCVVVLLIACAGPAPEVDPEYRAEIESWRAERLERLTSDTGWLTLGGLYWLEIELVTGRIRAPPAVASPPIARPVIV